MRIVHLVAGAGGMYCGSCLSSNTLVAALREAGQDALLVPLYTPLRLDENDVSLDQVFFGGINLYLRQQLPLFQHAPRAFTRLLDSPRLLRWLGKRGWSTRPEGLGPLVVSMLRGEEGRQGKEIQRLVRWLRDEIRPQLVHLSNAMLVGMARMIRQELGVPVCFHAGATKAIQFPPYAGFSSELTAAMEAITRPVSSVLVVANFLFSRILFRFPRLKVVFAETSLAWGAYELELADHQFERQRLNMEGYELRPSELFKRQCYLTGWFDHTGIETRYHIGIDNIMWSTNFPLATSTWPNSRDFIARCFAGVPDEERHQMLWGNAAKLYQV